MGQFMRDVTSANFGLLIAYVLPGFALLWGLEPRSTTVASWIGAAPNSEASVGGFLYVTVASVALGLLVSTLRWLLLDSLHHHTGISFPDWDFSRLADSVQAFDHLIEIHYRYYQWHGNGMLALIIAVMLRWTASGCTFREVILIVLISVLLFVGSRDTLRKYYRRVDDLFRRDA